MPAGAQRGVGVTYGRGRLLALVPGRPGGAALGGADGGVRPLAEVPLAVADQRPLVALHALQLLLGAHAAPCRAGGGVGLVQGTLGPLLGGEDTWND